jgi:hypothetical protein
VEFARRHVEQILGGALSVRTDPDPDRIASSLRKARIRYRSPLARQILLEAACGIAGGDARSVLSSALGCP